MKNILITGAENKSGLGFEIAKAMEDNKMGKIYNIGKEDLKNGNYKYIIKELIEKNFKKFDIIINNFGINHLSNIGQTKETDIDILNCNIFIPYDIINTIVSISNYPARVLNISSQTYRVAQRNTSLYCASKAALSHMTKVMARELAPKGWVINALAPGKIEDTTMSKMTDEQVCKLRSWTKEEADKYAKKLIPMERFTTRKEVAEAVYKILQLPSYINGETIGMTGGV